MAATKTGSVCASALVWMAAASAVAQPAIPPARSDAGGAPWMLHVLPAIQELDLTSSQQTALRDLVEDLCERVSRFGGPGARGSDRGERAEARRQELILGLQAGEVHVLDLFEHRAQKVARRNARRSAQADALRALVASLDSVQSQALSQALSASLATGARPEPPDCDG